MSDNVTVSNVHDLMKKGQDFVFIDVRNADEYAFCSIKGTKLIPLGELGHRLSEIPKDKLVVLHCHHGGRSMRAVNFLKSQGYEQVKNLEGGIDQWSIDIDQTMPRY